MNCHADLSIGMNPGNLQSNLGRHMYNIQQLLLKWFITYPPIHGAYTELFAGVSDQVTSAKTGSWSECFEICQFHVTII